MNRFTMCFIVVKAVRLVLFDSERSEKRIGFTIIVPIFINILFFFFLVANFSHRYRFDRQNSKFVRTQKKYDNVFTIKDLENVFGCSDHSSIE